MSRDLDFRRIIELMDKLAKTEIERDILRKALERRLAKGGRAPYGFRVEAGRLVRVEAEQEVIAAAREAKAGGLSLRAIARVLEQRGFLSRVGKTFAPEQVSKLFAPTQIARMLEQEGQS